MYRAARPHKKNDHILLADYEKKYNSNLHFVQRCPLMAEVTTIMAAKEESGEVV